MAYFNSRRMRFLAISTLGLALALGAWRAQAAKAKAKKPEVITADLAQWKRAFAEARAQPGTRGVFVNVWATWCEPCKEEMPDLIRFARDPKARGVRVMLISADPTSERAAVGAYLASLGVDFPTYLKTGDDMEFINGIDPKWDGTIPASWLFEPNGQRAHLWTGKVTYADLMARAEKLPPVSKPASQSPAPSPARRKP